MMVATEMPLFKIQTTHCTSIALESGSIGVPKIKCTLGRFQTIARINLKIIFFHNISQSATALTLIRHIHAAICEILSKIKLNKFKGPVIIYDRKKIWR